MTIEDQIKDEKLQYDINREAAKISALSSGKIDKYKYLTGEEILPNQREIEKYVDRDKMVYKSANKTYNFRSFKTIRTFGNKIRNNVISMTTENTEQANLLNHIEDFIKKTKPRDPILKKLKEDVLTSVLSLFNGRELKYKAFESRIFQKLEESQKGEGRKILTPNQMLKRLPIALAQVKAGNNSESLLNEIRQIVYSLYRSKEITKEVYNNIINSIKP